MGIRGPVAKRSEVRTRRNKTDEAGVEVKKGPASSFVKPPAEDRDWHRVIKAWYRSLKTSGQSKFYEDSDWQAARFTAHYASSVLKAAESTENPSALRAASIRQIWSMMGDLMTTESARRRVRVELIRPGAGEGGEGEGAEVVDIDDFREDYA